MLREKLLQKINKEFESPLHSVAKTFNEEIKIYLEMDELDDETLQEYLDAEDSGRAVLKFIVQEEPQKFGKVLERKKELIEEEISALLIKWEIANVTLTGEPGLPLNLIAKHFSEHSIV